MSNFRLWNWSELRFRNCPFWGFGHKINILRDNKVRMCNLILYGKNFFSFKNWYLAKLGSVHKWRHHLRGEGFGKDDWGGVHVGLKMTLLFYMIFGKHICFIISKSSNWYLDRFLFIELSYFMFETFSLIDICFE